MAPGLMVTSAAEMVSEIGNVPVSIILTEPPWYAVAFICEAWYEYPGLIVPALVVMAAASSVRLFLRGEPSKTDMASY